MRLTVLGTAAPYPRPSEPCSGYLLQSDAPDGARATSVWVDAGSGTLAELQRHISLVELDAIWISHRHADHSSDLLVAYYALRFSELRPRHPVPLFGPADLVDRMGVFLGRGSVPQLPRVFDFRAMTDAGRARVGGLELEWTPVQHGDTEAFALGATDAEPSASPATDVRATADAVRRPRLVYSGDSAPCAELEGFAAGADLLLLEAGAASLPEAGAHDAATHHTAEEAGRAASVAGARRLVLTHIANEVGAESALAQASVTFASELAAAHPGAVFEV
jgi:ribonuclease BN (tRNA processing enzyme)